MVTSEPTAEHPREVRIAALEQHWTREQQGTRGS
jgi:hypothetical protein